MKGPIHGLIVALLVGAGCADTPAGPGGADVAGHYQLAAVDGQSLPCCAATDSTGATVTLEAGTLVLGEASPTAYAYTPSGAVIPTSCVHEIPNGATVDTANVVHMPDGSSYTLPRCGDAPYSLVLARRYASPDGSARIVADTLSGLYAWGGLSATGSQGRVTLVDAGLAGTVLAEGGGVEIRVARQHVGPPGMWPHEPEYLFSRVAD